MKRFLLLVIAVCLVGLSRGSRATSPIEPPMGAAPDAGRPPAPADAGALWFVPAEEERRRLGAGHDDLAGAAEKYAAGDFADALKLARRAAASPGPLQDYANLYAGLSQLRAGQIDGARQSLAALRESKPPGYVAVAAALAGGEAAEAAGEYAAALALYESLADDKASVNEDVLMRVGRTALAAGDRKKAANAYSRVYYEYALTDAASTAAEQLATLQDHIVRTGYKADLARASMLFGARRYSDARAAYQSLLAEASGDDLEVVELRVAETDFFLKRYETARARLEPHLDRASRKAEARFFYLSALRELGRDDQYIERTRALVDEFPDSSWSEEALNNLGTFYILENSDDLAAQAFAELYQKFPSGPRAERAAWKTGWWSYKNGDYAGTVRTFESAAHAFPRSDYRPSFLYWSARSHGKLDRGAEAVARLQQVHADYGNSYYGRLAARQLARPGEARPALERPLPASRLPVSAAPINPPTEGRIRTLLAAGLYDDALNELRYAQRSWGGGPALDATMAWAYHRKGELRRAITIMRRAYPQFLAAGGHELPNEILQVIFPLTYWDSIRKHSIARGLDPYMIAALIAQESTFDPSARSVANAWGMMQIVPATGRRLARTLGIRRFTTATLTNADTNIRMGTLYFSQLARQFGGTHYALASYNAGESRVVRWKAERPGLDEDEFVDDIPFPETQNYVKRILGTAEDYRRLYSEAGGRPIPVAVEEAVVERTAPAKVTRKPTPSKTTKKPVRRTSTRR